MKITTVPFGQVDCLPVDLFTLENDQGVTVKITNYGGIVTSIVVPDRKPVNLFKFFWSEIRMVGARLYEPEDFEAAIELLGKQRLPIDSLITQVSPIEETQQVFELIDANPAGMKYVIQCGEST